MAALEKLKSFINSDNISSDLDKNRIEEIGNQVLIGFEEDFNSSSEWLADVKQVEELALLTSQKKETPLPNSANIKFPIITKACYEFSSRTYPEIVKDGQIVKGKIIGKDYTGDKNKKLDKVTEYMNWQLYWQNDDWELELDRLLNRIALIGFICKKVYYDPIRNTIKSELCEPQDLIINCDVKSLDDARRVSHIIHVRLNDLIEGQRAGIYSKEPIDKLVKRYSENDLEPQIDLIEQHAYFDLDEDDYAEPYIITVLKETGEVIRIVARYSEKSIKSSKGEIKYINPDQYFVDYHFLVSPKGKFQSVGFGILLLHLNITINTILNQLIDSGQLSNYQGGYIDSRLKEIGGQGRKNPGDWTPIKSIAGMTLKDGILPIDYKEPSSVLLQLLGLLIDAAKDLSSSSDIMTGNASPENSKTGATQALIGEGVKIHNSINKRVYRSLNNEFYKIFHLNSIFLNEKEAQKVVDDITQKDFDEEAIDIIPIADPNLASGVKLAQEIQILIALQALPGFDPIAISKRIAQKSQIDKYEEIMIDENKKQPPNPDMLKLQADIENMAEQSRLKGHELELKEKQLKLDEYKTHCEILKMKADAILSIAKAESLEQGTQMDLYTKQLDTLSQAIDRQMQQEQMYHDRNMQNAELEMRQQEVDNAQQTSGMDASSSQ